MIFKVFLALACVFGGMCSTPDHDPEQVVRLNLRTEPPSLDSRLFSDATSANVLLMLYEGLTRMDETGKPRPALAKSFEVSADGRVYTFRLREAVWSDGASVTAHDFVQTWKTILDPAFPAPFAYKLYCLERFEAVDEKTLVVELKHPSPYFLEELAFPTFFPVREGATNGPFVMEKWAHDDELVVVKNPLYWDAEKVCLDRIEMVMIEDSTTELYMYEMDELDWAGSPISSLPSDVLPALLEKGDVEMMKAKGVYYYLLNPEVYPLTNQNVRRALGLALDRASLVEHILQGGQSPALALVPHVGYACYADQQRDVARTLLAEGLSELGVERLPPLTISFNTNREHQKIAQAIQEQWRETLGVETRLESSDWKVYIDKVNRKDYQICRLGWMGDSNDPLSFLDPFAEHVGATLAKAQTTLDEREMLLREAEEELLEKMPVIPLYHYTFAYMKKPHVRAVYVSPLGFADFKRAYIAR